MKIIFIPILFLYSFIWGGQQVHGVLVGQGGRPLAKGLVVVCSLVDGNRVAMVETDASGGFSIRSSFQGLYEIQFLGVGHMPAVFPLNFKKDRQSYLRIQLAPRVWSAPTSSRIRVEGSKDGEPLPNSAALLKAGDGSYRATFECQKSLRYHLLPLGHNPRATEFLYDGVMDFHSVQYPKDGRVEVVVRPSDFAAEKVSYSVTIQDEENMALMRAHELLEGVGAQFGGLVQAQRQSYIRHLEQRQRPAEFHWDGSKEIAMMDQYLNHVKTPLVHDFWTINQWRYLLDCGMPIPPSIQDRVMCVSPDSPAWVLVANPLKARKTDHTPSSSWQKLIQAIQVQNPNQDLITFLTASPR